MMSFGVSDIKLASLIDLTLLSDHCTESDVAALCQKAMDYQVAAVCLYPRFIPVAKRCLAGKLVKIATVCNFPYGRQPIEQVLLEIESALEKGADEIDVVFPYRVYLDDRQQEAINFVRLCKTKCSDGVVLKVILETGVFPQQNLIYTATLQMIAAGVNFIKTSTGKTAVGATLPAAESILKAIKASKNEKVGIKLSGGINTLSKAQAYVNLAESIMGSAWIKPEQFRIGASHLLESLNLNELS